MKNNHFGELKPVLKWAGGKRQIIDVLLNSLPKQFNTYYEPFVGAGALFLELKNCSAIINDINFEIANLYKVLSNKEKVEKLIKELKNYEKSYNNLKDIEEKESFYYKTRAVDKIRNYYDNEDYLVAARTIFLNKSCFNGIFRLNSKGEFNVPFGKKEKIKLFDENNIVEINKYISQNQIEIFNSDFEEILNDAKKGDLVYFDPPYDVIDNKQTFTGYSKEGFSKNDQVRLANKFKELDKKGIFLMLSNHNTDLIKELYAGYNFQIIKARRNINSKGQERGPVEEVLITNYEK